MLLKNSSLSAAPLDLFSAPTEASYHPAETVPSLTFTPDTANRNSALWEWVAQGLSSRSLANSFVAFSSSSGLLPAAFLGSRVAHSSSWLQ